MATTSEWSEFADVINDLYASVNRLQSLFPGRKFTLDGQLVGSIGEEADAPPSLELKHRKMVLRIRPGTNEEGKKALVARWYRQQIKAVVPDLIAKWEPILGVKVDRFFVQSMKTKWGSCNPTSKRIRLNTDLAKKPPECLEYIVVHEMAHLLVRHHNDLFSSLMDKCLPNWKQLRQRLNDTPLAHTDWAY